jgi:hypothetical protein
VSEEQGLGDAGNEELITARDTFAADLRSSASITWHDVDLRRLYQQALAAE